MKSREVCKCEGDRMGRDNERSESERQAIRQCTGRESEKVEVGRGKAGGCNEARGKEKRGGERSGDVARRNRWCREGRGGEGRPEC